MAHHAAASCGTLGKWTPPTPNEQQALDAQAYYAPGMQQGLSVDEQERAHGLIPCTQISWLKALWPWRS